jgi:hypothetical protein
MNTLFKVVLINVSALVGFVLVLSTIPDTTSWTLIGFSCLGTLVVINVAAFVWPRYRKPQSTASPDSKSTTATVIFVWIVFLLGLVWNWMHWHHR